MSEFAPKKLPEVVRCSAMKHHLASGEAFRTDLFGSHTPGEPSNRLAEYGITECSSLGQGDWLVKTEFEKAYRVVLEKPLGTRPLPMYTFRPITSKKELSYFEREAMRKQASV